LGNRHRSYALPALTLSLVFIISLAALPNAGCAGSPDLTVNSIWLEDASQPGRPVSQVSSGESFLIVATIKNIGQQAASGYYLDVYYDSDFGRGGPDNIAAGETQTWYVGPLTAQDGMHTTQWVADPDNQIAELNESNNLMQYTFTVGQQATTTTTIQTTQILTSTGTTSVISYTTTTLTSYVGTETSTSTIVIPETVTASPSVSTSTLEVTQVQTSIGTTTVTAYTTTTLSSYARTETSISTIVVPTTVTLGGAGASTVTTQITQVQTSTGTTTVTGYTTTTIGSYVTTTTSTSTTVVYTTVSNSGGASGASIPLVFLSVLSLFGVVFGGNDPARKGSSISGAGLTFAKAMFSPLGGTGSLKPLNAKSPNNRADV
jgi:hypothetical protein